MAPFDAMDIAFDEDVASSEIAEDEAICVVAQELQRGAELLDCIISQFHWMKASRVLYDNDPHTLYILTALAIQKLGCVHVGGEELVGGLVVAMCELDDDLTFRSLI
jgi:hypothetical protein